METTHILQHPLPIQSCNREELDQIVSALRHCTSPEEILLFGSFAGATPFSEIPAYDLLVLTAAHTSKEWKNILNYLCFKFPTHTRTVSFINLYICSPADLNGGLMPFYRFVCATGCGSRMLSRLDGFREKALYKSRITTTK